MRNKAAECDSIGKEQVKIATELAYADRYTDGLISREGLNEKIGGVKPY